MYSVAVAVSINRSYYHCQQVAEFRQQNYGVSFDILLEYDPFQKVQLAYDILYFIRKSQYLLLIQCSNDC